MKKFIFTAFLAFALTAPVFASSDVTVSEVTSDKAPIAVNGWADNWFVLATGGVNTILNNGFWGAVSPAVDIMAGKWVSPYWAIRVGYRGLTNRAIDTSNGWFAGADAFSYNFVHLDWQWDALNSIMGYRQDRLVHLRPMAQAGAIITGYDGKSKVEFGFGGGLQVGFKISKRIEANLEGSFILAREETYCQAGKLLAFPSVVAGVAVNIGKVGFDRKERVVRETVTVEVPVDCNHKEQLAALEAEIDRLKALKSEAPSRKVSYEGFVTYFVLDKSEVLERERYHLMDLVDILPEDAVITLTGHADKETGNPRHNERLSKRRVEAVSAALRDLGFKGEIKADYKGDTANPFGSPYPKNRCVTFEITF